MPLKPDGPCHSSSAAFKLHDRQEESRPVWQDWSRADSKERHVLDVAPHKLHLGARLVVKGNEVQTQEKKLGADAEYLWGSPIGTQPCTWVAVGKFPTPDAPFLVMRGVSGVGLVVLLKPRNEPYSGAKASFCVIPPSNRARRCLFINPKEGTQLSLSTPTRPPNHHHLIIFRKVPRYFQNTQRNHERKGEALTSPSPTTAPVHQHNPRRASGHRKRNRPINQPTNQKTIPPQ